MAHAMTEFAFDIFYGKYSDIQEISAKRMVKWIDNSILKIREEINQKQKRRTDVKRAEYYETKSFISTNPTENINSIDVFRLRQVRRNVHTFNIVIDPTLKINESFYYDKSGIRIEYDSLPVAVAESIRTMCAVDKEDKYLSQILSLSDITLKIPDLKITSITQEGPEQDFWLEMETSWLPWEAMRERILAKHG